MFYSIRTQLIAIIVILIVPFVIMGFLFWNQAAGALRGSIETSTVQTLNQYADFAEGTASQLTSTANQILRNETTQGWIRSRKEDGDTEQIQQNYNIKKYFDSVIGNNSSLLMSINIFYGAWDMWNLDGDSYMSSKWYADYHDKGLRWPSAHYDDRQNGSVQNGTPINSLVYPLSDLWNLREVGILKLNMRTSYLQEPLDKLTLGATGKAYLITTDGKPVLSQTPPELPESLLAYIRSSDHASQTGTQIYRNTKEQTIYFYQTLKTMGWIVVGSVSEKELFQEITVARRNFLIVASLLFAATVALAFWLSASLASPISRVVRSMRYVEAGDFFRGSHILTKLKVKPNEIGYLTFNYKKMVDRLQTYIETEFASNLRRRNAEYKALLLQINPHFLNNTLEVITSLAAQGRHHDIEQVVGDLSRMLRSTLRVDTELIRLRDEVAYIRAFTSILSTCYGSRVAFQITETHAHDDILIPKLLLQPLIENAVKYSLGIVETAKISIEIEELDEQMRFTIRDNGGGIPEDVLEKLQSVSHDNFALEVLEIGEKGIGLKNVLARGRMHYGAAFQFDIRTVAGEGSEITMTVPKKG
ncbi:cache domain-containing sensor histidine kinase [Cohnella soli]|uniref:histidine kinase n=1 Tax=Cohnella soli TaxID=425005 RepID=A0ABW0I0D3_9BACL